MAFYAFRYGNAALLLLLILQDSRLLLQKEQVKGLKHSQPGLILSIAFFALGIRIKRIAAIRPASDYEDMEIHTFFPYKVLPHTMENHATGRDKRNNPTKTVYVVYYQASDATGYQWKPETSNSKDHANQILAQRKA